MGTYWLSVVTVNLTTEYVELEIEVSIQQRFQHHQLT
jgi:hypothetical protein